MDAKKSVLNKKVVSLLERQHIASVPLSESERLALQVKWRKVFAPRVKKLTGDDVYRGYDWHAFSYSLVFGIEGDDARQEYERQNCSEFYVIPHMNEGVAYKCHSSRLPQFSRKGVDVYVCPNDFSWTMVFTHEDDWFGPYFTRAEWATRPTQPKLN